MTTIHVPVPHLKAILCTAAKGDERSYLNGVAVEATKNRTITISTTGQVIGAIRSPDAVNDCDGTESTPTLVIIPREACDLAIRAAPKEQEFFEITDDDYSRWRIGDIGFTPIGGQFVDWRAVMPTEAEERGVAGHFNVANLVLFQRAAMALDPRGAGIIKVHQRGEQCAGITIASSPEYRGVIAPLKAVNPVPWSLPTWAVPIATGVTATAGVEAVPQQVEEPPAAEEQAEAA